MDIIANLKENLSLKIFLSLILLTFYNMVHTLIIFHSLKLFVNYKQHI